MTKHWTFTVVEQGINTRIVDFGAHAFPILGSKSATKKALSGGRLFLNGREAVFSDVLKKGDIIELRGSGVHEVKKLDIDLDIVYEDDFLVVVNKPGGLAVNGNRYKTVENALAGINQNNRQPDALPRPIAVHRLDVPTCGLVMVAKTKSALIRLSRSFQENEVRKEYFAVIHGKLPAKGYIDEPVEGKKAITEFESLHTVPSRNYKNLSLLKLQPVTGRTHQLRIHLKNKGHLIVGDKLYADDQKTILGKGLLLCACKLQFRHPSTGKTLELLIDPPPKFDKVLQRENDRFNM